MEKHFVRVAGGGVKMEQTTTVSCMGYVRHDATIRAEMWERNRTDIIRRLEKESGLPFRVAIQHIRGWLEQEYQPPREPGDFWYGLPKDDLPVYFRTVCYVEAAEYLEEREGPHPLATAINEALVKVLEEANGQDAADDPRGPQETPGGVAGGAGGGPGRDDVAGDEGD